MVKSSYRNHGWIKMTGKPIMTSKVVDEKGILHEQIFNYETQEAKYIGYNGTGFTESKEIHIGKIVYQPLLNEAVLKKAVLLPSNILNYPDIETLIKEIRTHIYKYVDITERYRQIASWYILSTWLIDKIGTTTYLRALGDYGTGKSRFKRVLGGLCYKPIFISGAITPAPIFRMIETWGGTLVFDEMDMRFSDEKDILVKILNSGNERFNPILRCSDKDYSKISFFDTFSPKVFCTRGRFKDQALETRCLTEVMRETTRTDITPLLSDGHPFFREEMTLRNKLLMFRLKSWGNLKIVEPDKIDLGDIEPRLKQDILPMAMLFWEISQMREEIKKFVKKYNNELVEERANSYEGMIVNTILEHIKEDSTLSTSPEKTTELNASMIAVMMMGRYKLEKQPSSASIGKKLRILGLETKPIKIDGKTIRAVMINEEKMSSLKRKYIPEVTVDTEVTGDIGTEKKTSSKKDLKAIFEEFEKKPIKPNTTVTNVTPVTETSSDSEVV